jgi:spore coat polysaccharide biosynthesis protein SpsF
MTTIAVVQARMGSTRLPGKVLMDLGGRPALALQLQRLAPLRAAAKVDELVIATSDLPADDPVDDLGQRLGVPVVRGSERDVLGRFVVARERFPAETVVRLTGDCPLSDPALVVAGLERHRATAADYTSNTLVRTHPDGLDVEVVQATALAEAAAEAAPGPEREHVTPFVYRRPERYRLAAFRAPRPLGDERWTLDTADDLSMLRAVVAQLDDPRRATWERILAVAGERNRPPADRPWIRPAGPADHDALRVLGAPVADGPDAMLDPASRVWAIELDGAVVGWFQLDVSAAAGQLRGALPNALIGTVDRDIIDRLRSDLQVVSLQVVPTAAVPA